LSEYDYDKVINYIKNDMQLIMHVNLAYFDKFLNDEYYRNTFETNVKGEAYLAGRKVWETNMFHKIYDNVEPFDRIKYGVLNLLNSPTGLASCTSYGDSFFIFKKDVKKRTTFTIGDSSLQQFDMGSFDHPDGLLLLLPDTEFCDLIRVATKKDITELINLKQVKHFNPYIEAQIHGSVKFDRDIESIVVPKKHRGNINYTDILNAFVIKNKCKLIWQ
jgi:hypothetical protein